MSIKKGDHVQITKGPFKGRIGFCRAINIYGACCISDVIADDLDDCDWWVWSKPEQLGLLPLPNYQTRESK